MFVSFRFLFFPLSLQSMAREWVYAMSDSIRTWKETYNAFIEKFLPFHQTFTFRLQLENFSQNKGEAFSKYWERFNNLLQSFQSNGYELWRILAIFL